MRLATAAACASLLLACRSKPPPGAGVDALLPLLAPEAASLAGRPEVLLVTVQAHRAQETWDGCLGRICAPELGPRCDFARAGAPPPLSERPVESTWPSADAGDQAATVHVALECALETRRILRLETTDRPARGLYVDLEFFGGRWRVLRTFHPSTVR